MPDTSCPTCGSRYRIPSGTAAGALLRCSLCATSWRNSPAEASPPPDRAPAAPPPNRAPGGGSGAPRSALEDPDHFDFVLAGTADAAGPAAPPGHVPAAAAADPRGDHGPAAGAPSSPPTVPEGPAAAHATPGAAAPVAIPAGAGPAPRAAASGPALDAAPGPRRPSPARGNSGTRTDGLTAAAAPSSAAPGTRRRGRAALALAVCGGFAAGALAMGLAGAPGLQERLAPPAAPAPVLAAADAAAGPEPHPAGHGAAPAAGSSDEAGSLPAADPGGAAPPAPAPPSRAEEIAAEIALLERTRTRLRSEVEAMEIERALLSGVVSMLYRRATGAAALAGAPPAAEVLGRVRTQAAADPRDPAGPHPERVAGLETASPTPAPEPVGAIAAGGAPPPSGTTALAPRPGRAPGEAGLRTATLGSSPPPASALRRTGELARPATRPAPRQDSPSRMRAPRPPAGAQAAPALRAPDGADAQDPERLAAIALPGWPAGTGLTGSPGAPPASPAPLPAASEPAAEAPEPPAAMPLAVVTMATETETADPGARRARDRRTVAIALRSTPEMRTVGRAALRLLEDALTDGACVDEALSQAVARVPEGAAEALTRLFPTC